LSNIKVLVFYNYFLPGYKAGGPVQSLSNMIGLLSETHDFSVITSAYDLNATAPYDSIRLNEWNRIAVNNKEIPVFYSSVRMNPKEIAAIIKTEAADIVYINGMYSWNFFLLPLFVKTFISKGDASFIISPRGMLQPGALQGKSFKKKIYLELLKLFGLTKNILWHATTADEVIDIKNIFGKKSKVMVASNIPKATIPFVDNNKQAGHLSLVYLSLIAEKKNLLLLINTLKSCKASISLDIYGPVKDEAYWQDCLKEMEQIPSNIIINYKGDVNPDKVQAALAKYDAAILLTKGENFGHALFESLSVGRPIITSHFTPWNELEKRNAGWNVDISDKESIANLLDELAAKTNEEWQLYCKGAHQLAVNYFEEQNFKEEYRMLFE